MSYSPEDSRIKLTAEQAAKVATMRPDEMKEYFRDIAVGQGLVTRDLDPNLLIENEGVEAAPTSQMFTKRITVDGRTLTFQGDSELAVEQAVGDFYRGEQAAREDGTATTREAAAPTRTAEEIATKIELELQFKRGEIDTATYLQESGAVASYLASQGVSMDGLREASSASFEGSWKSATDEWMATPEGQSWIGGEQNMRTIGDIIAKFNLTDQPSAETLSRAVRYAKENDMLVENPQLTQRQKIEEAQSPEQLREALGRSRDDYRSVYGR
jgi:hypothetical protein